MNPNECACALRYRWNMSTKSCDPIFPLFMTAPLVNTTCDVGLQWDATYGCIVDCPNIANAAGPKDGNLMECVCTDKYIWDRTNFICTVNCSVVNSMKVPDGYGGCQCPPANSWNQTMVSCSPDCSQVASAIGLSSDNASCICKQNFIWNSTLGICAPNCSNISNTNNTVQTPQTSCSCNTGFQWNPLLGMCAISCRNVAKTNNLPSTDGYNCRCKLGYRWDGTTQTCIINCVGIPKSTGEVVDQNLAT